MKDLSTELGQKPPQRVSYKTRIANNYEHTKDTMQYYISKAAFDPTTKGEDEKTKYYQIYNNIFPEEWFNFVVNPYNTDKKEYKNFPSRIRELTIIRPNIDLLVGEWLKRPFNKVVNNYSEDAYNMYQEQLWEQVKSNMTQHFINYINQMGVQGGQPEENTPLPQKLAEQFNSNYKDSIAIKGQKLINRVEREAEMEEDFIDMFKDWAIVGETYSFKDVIDNKIVYERVSPLDLDYGKSSRTRYVEDGEWAIRRISMTIADVVDRFYDSLKKADIEKLEKPYNISTPVAFYNSLDEEIEQGEMVEVLHVVWKTQVKEGIFYYFDPLTGEPQEMDVDETFKVPKGVEGKVVWNWVNEIWEGYRINDDLFVEMGPRVGDKLPYNGKRFSDLHAKNTSVLRMGIPYQILYIILNYRLELTIAKSKGKIVLLDKHVIPSEHGWDEDKFFYYSEATGWGLIDRQGLGVDKTYNQYQVLDLGLYEHISNLIQLLEYVKQDWDEVLGINRQRKGQTTASDAVGTTERAVFQSSIMSELTFINFEKFMEREFQGILELMPYAYTDGVNAIYTSDNMRTEILSITPEELTMADLGVFATSSSKDTDKIRSLKEYAQQSLASGGNLGAVAKIVASDNMSEVLRILETAKNEEMEIAKAQEEAGAAREEKLKQIEQEFQIMAKQLDEAFMNAEYDRKEILEHIKGQYAQTKSSGTEVASPSAPQDSAVAIQKEAREAVTASAQMRQKDRELDLKEKELNDKRIIERDKNKTALKNKVAGEK